MTLRVFFSQATVSVQLFCSETGASCLTLQVASGSLRSVLASVSNVTSWTAAADGIKVPFDSTSDKYFKFLFVRHPLQRMIAVYHYLFSPTKYVRRSFILLETNEQ